VSAFAKQPGAFLHSGNRKSSNKVQDDLLAQLREPLREQNAVLSGR